MLGIIIAISSALFMAGMYILLKKSYKELDPSVAFFFDAIFGLIIWIPIGFIFGAKVSEISQTFVYAIISAILSEAFVFYALSKGNLSVALTLISTYPMFTLIFSFLINGELLTIPQLLFVIVAIIGIILTCIEKEFTFSAFKKPVILIPTLAAVAIGLSDTLTKQIINETSSFSFLVSLAIVQVPVALIYLKISKQSIKKTFTEMVIKKEDVNVEMDKSLDTVTHTHTHKYIVREYGYGILGSLLNIIATGLLLISFNYTMASIASPLTAMYTAIVLVYAFAFMKEKVSRINGVGIVLTFIGSFGIIILGG